MLPIVASKTILYTCPSEFRGSQLMYVALVSRFCVRDSVFGWRREGPLKGSKQETSAVSLSLPLPWSQRKQQSAPSAERFKFCHVEKKWDVGETARWNEKDQVNVRERVNLFQSGHTNCAFDTNLAFSWNVFACVTPSLLKIPTFLFSSIQYVWDAGPQHWMLVWSCPYNGS